MQSLTQRVLKRKSGRVSGFFYALLLGTKSGISYLPAHKFQSDDMQERHINRQKYFDEQVRTVQKYVVPYIEYTRKISDGMRVLEIGCGEGGNLKPFLDIGCVCVGVDLSETKIKNGKQLFSGHPKGKNLHLLIQDIYQVEELPGGAFDLVIMRDVIEHIPNQEYFMSYVKKFLKDDGLFFLGFPPWQNPFGGHQQNCVSFISKLPWIHLLPKFLYRSILNSFESQRTVKAMMEIRSTRISLDRFDRILKNEQYRIYRKTLYFINPNYETKFGLKPRVQLKIFSAIPYFKNFVVTAGYYLIGKN